MSNPVPYDINGQLRKKVKTWRRRNERCQSPKTSFDFVVPFAFEKEHRFENVFAFIM